MKKQTLLDRLANAMGYIKQGVALTSASIFGLPIMPSKKMYDYLLEYRSWVFGCVNARARETAQVKIHLFKILNRKTGEVEEVLEHDALSLLETVNPWQTKRDLLFNTQAYKDLSGEAYWWIARAKNGTPMQIWMFRPDFIHPIPSADNFLVGYEYRLPGKDPIRFEPNEIVPFKTFNPVNPHRGASIIGAAAETIDTDNEAEKYNLNFFKNGALPSIVLSTEQKLTQDIVNRLRAQWEREYGGTEKAHRMAILEGGLSLTAFSLSQRDMDFLLGQKYNRDKIFALFQTPKTVLGMTEDVNLANAEATDLIFSKRVVKPNIESIVDVLNEFYLPLFPGSENMFFDFEDPVPENVEKKLLRYKELFNIGAITPNEVRSAEGLDEVEGLDNFYLPLNYLPVTSESRDPEVADEPIKFTGSQRTTRKYLRPEKMIIKVRREITGKVLSAVADVTRGKMSSILKSEANDLAEQDMPKSTWSVEKQEAFWKRMVRLSEQFEKRYQDELVKYFGRQKEAVLARFNDVTKAFDPKDINKVLFEVGVENKLAINVLLPIIKALMEEHGNDVLEELGITDIAFNTTDEAVRFFTTDRGLRGIKALNRVTKSKLRKQLQQGIQLGESIAQIERRIRNVYEEATRVRSIRIARTEVLKATNQATLEAYKQSGVVTGKEWFTALDEKVCQWCAPMQGRVKALDNDYFIQGESFVGKEGGKINFEIDDVSAPPLHPMCRCTLIPITISARTGKPIARKENKPDIVELVDQEVARAKKEITEQVTKDIDDKFGELAEKL